MAWSKDPNLDLYWNDEFHPSELASSLGALALFQQIFDEPTVGLPSLMVPTTQRLASLSIPSRLNTLPQEVAAAANAELGIR